MADMGIVSILHHCASINADPMSEANAEKQYRTSNVHELLSYFK